MKKYSMAFIFNNDLSRVLLIHKIRPEWQRGRINGLGGKIEENESPQECISREVQEESTLAIYPNDWKYFGEMVNEDKSTTQLFTCMYQGEESEAKTVEDQKVEWFDVATIPNNVMTNLLWLIPMALDKVKNNKLQTVRITY